jgi:hypothetical protein
VRKRAGSVLFFIFMIFSDLNFEYVEFYSIVDLELLTLNFNPAGPSQLL